MRCLSGVTPGEEFVEACDLVVGDLAEHPRSDRANPGDGVALHQKGAPESKSKTGAAKAPAE